MTARPYEDFGAYVRARRKKLGLTQDDLARMMGVSQPTVSTWERGESAPSDARRLSRMLDVPWQHLADRLFGQTNPVEHAIATDKTLNRKGQRALLAAYGELAGRDSVRNASAFVWVEPSDSDAA